MLSFALLLVSGLHANATMIEAGRIEKGQLYFTQTEGTPPKPIKIEQLAKPKVLGLLRPNDGGVPYVLVQGLECESCQTEKKLKLYRVDGSKEHDLVYPGKVRHRGRTLLDARAFFGKCLAGRGDVYVVFQKEKVDRRRYLQRSVFIAEPKAGALSEKLVVRRRPNISKVLKRVRGKKKACVEIKGYTRGISRKLVPPLSAIGRYRRKKR